MTHRRFIVAAILVAWIGVAGGAVSIGAVKLPPVFSNHMVLQRDMAVPIWGTAGANEKVTVKFRDQEKSVDADAAGKWSLKLDPLKVGGPDKLIIGNVTIDDVLVGDVWVGSGQSNMAMGAKGPASKEDKELAKWIAESYPQLRLFGSGKPGWAEATPQNNPGFSALLFSFGVPLQKELKIPVGLYVGAVGGTPSGYWLSPEALAADAPCQEMIKKATATYDASAAQKLYEKEYAAWQAAAAKAKADGKKEPRAPRKPALPGQASGGEIGNLYIKHIRPIIPFAIKGVLWDQGESGTNINGVDQYTLMGALIRGWRQEWGQGEFPFIYVQKISGGGCAWDASDPITAKAEHFAPLPKAPAPTAAGIYRETHIRIMNYPNTAMVISSDLGRGTHPVLKSSYGLRACRVALGAVYGQKIEYYGPIYQSQKIEGNKIRLTFTHVGQGLAFKNGETLQGFAIAGEDKKFVWADAVIDGDTVVVSSGEVANPVAVRYAWDASIPWANLFNKDGLPAPAFRTDQW